MDNILPSALRICRGLRYEFTAESWRRLEHGFYLIYAQIGFGCAIAPFAFDVSKKAYIPISVISFAYLVLFFFIRYKIHVPIGLLLHTGWFIVLSGGIFLAEAYYIAGGLVVALGLVCEITFLMFFIMGYNVFVRNATNRQQADQLGHEMNVIDGQRRENEVNRHQGNMDGNAPVPEFQVEPQPEMQRNGGVFIPRDFDRDGLPPPEEQPNGGVFIRRDNAGVNPPPELPINGGVNPPPELPINRDVNDALLPEANQQKVKESVKAAEGDVAGQKDK